MCGSAAKAFPNPWWSACGIDPDWILGKPGSADSAVAQVRVRGVDGIEVRRPLRLRTDHREALVRSCQEGGGLAVCAAVWTESGAPSIRASGVSIGAPDAGRSGFSGEAGWSAGALRLSSAMRAGDGTSAVSGTASLVAAGARMSIGAGRVRRGDTLLLGSGSGNLALSWDDRTDSGGIALDVPLGPVVAGASLWSSRIRSLPGAGMSDTGDVSGWTLRSGGRFLDAWLTREDRRLATTGRRGDRIFHRQRISLRKAEAVLRLHLEGWESELGARQTRAELPQGDLESPTVWWNGLASDPFATVYSVYSDARDYWSGEVFLSVGRFSVRRNWTGPGWSAGAGFQVRSWDLDCDLFRRRLQVTGLIPSVALDTIASGSGWFAVAGPGLDLARSLGGGRLEGGFSMEFPLAGEWKDRIRRPHAEGSRSLPIDPWSLWNASLRWCW